MEHNSPLLASQRALTTAEILCIIFTFLSPRYYRTQEKPKSARGRFALLNCTLVNSTWSSEAIRALWVEPTAYSRHTLGWIFDWVPVRRRQVYADIVLRATIHTVIRMDMIRSFDGVNLRKLQSLTLLVHTPAHSVIMIPLITHPSVEHLSIGSVNGYFDKDKEMAAAMWEKLFKSIAELFPNLRSLHFQEKVFKDLRILVKLKRDLQLKSLRQKTWEAPTVDV
ncbi:hypothetical protein N7508_010940 [Penicillium antarcticum]|uniref:uncharacterized protein n=1 Tax=Penicillium antarcticum TaxID=416450 RepID=UPI0023A72CF2|nr:uncharacterized protein N7508_010940 [Penicillium antarcticum]KAJ5296119.1 hypothetical protein N7508_010940 [Penicillium antarcticum]